MIENYKEKMDYFLNRQNYKCSGCGKEFKTIGGMDGDYYEWNETDKQMYKLDFAHELPRTKKNIKKYPLFIDSIENGSIQHNFCNVARRPPYWKYGEYKKEKPINYYQAEQIEKGLREGIN